MKRAVRRVFLGPVRLYQLFISPLFPPSCRFHPTCSNYAISAVERYGVVRGGWLAVKRIARCHPWNPGGYDPVPGTRRDDDEERRDVEERRD